MEGNDGTVPGGQLPDEVFDAVGKVAGHHVLHRGGQVQNDLVFRGGVEMLQHCLADVHGKVHLCAHEGLGGVLVPEVHAGGDDRLAQFVDQVRRVGGNLGDAVHVHLEDHLPLEGGGGVVEVQDYVFRALDGLKGLLDQMGPGLDQHLDGHVVGNVTSLDQLPADLIFRFGGGGEADFDLLDADVHQGVEHLQLFLQVHGIDQRLVPVPQIHTAPDGGGFDLLIRPGAVGQGDGLIGNVLLIAWFHDVFLL